MIRQATLFIVLAFCVSECSGQERDTESAGRPPQKWAMLIGVNQYAAATPLKYAERDMEQLERLLLASGFDRDHVLTFTNSAREVARRPFRSLIERQLDRLLGRLDAKGNLVKPGLVQAGDVVVVALSGHGVHFEEEGSFFCPSDADLDYPDTLVSLKRVYERLLNSKASLKLIIVDACRNDPRKPAKGVAVVQPEATNRFAQSLSNRPAGIVMMTSCKAGQVSREDSDLGHGVFLKHVLEGLEGPADQPKQNNLGIGDANGRVSLEEAFQFAKQKTVAYVAKKWNTRQEPEIIVGNERDALGFEFGTYSSLLPFTSFFTVRVENSQGPPARGAEIVIRYRASETAPSVVLGRVNVDDSGKAELTLRLSKQQRTTGFYTGTVFYDGTNRTSDLPGFLEQREWSLYAPHNSPLAERVKELLAAKKTNAALNLVWKEWEQADNQVKQLIAPHAAIAGDWWMSQAQAEVETESDPRRMAACYAVLAVEYHRRGNSESAQACFAKSLAAVDRVPDAIEATHVALEVMRSVANAGDVAMARQAAKRASLLAEGIPMDGQENFDKRRRVGFVHRLMRMHVNIQIAAALHRLHDPDANHYLEVGYELFRASSDSSNFYHDLAAYGRIMALCLAGDTAQLKRMEHLKGGQLRLYQLSGKRKFIPLNSPNGLRASNDHQEQLTAWSLRLYCEIALAAATYQARDLYRVFSRAADTQLTAAGQRQVPTPVIAECLEILIQAAARNGEMDSALKRMDINQEKLSPKQRNRIRQAVAERLSTDSRFDEAWQQLTLLSTDALAPATYHRVFQNSWKVVAEQLIDTLEIVRKLPHPADRAAVYAALATQSSPRTLTITNGASTSKLHVRTGKQTIVLKPKGSMAVKLGEFEFYDGAVWKQFDDSLNDNLTFEIQRSNGVVRWVLKPKSRFSKFDD